jgi:hypothetical protein
MVRATAVPKVKAATKLKKAAQSHGDARRQHARGNHRGDGVRGIVEAVEKIEA